MKRELIPVEGHKGLARDPKSGAVLNINKDEIQQARARKAQRRDEAKRLDKLEDDVDDIKLMLTQILEKL